MNGEAFGLGCLPSGARHIRCPDCNATALVLADGTTFTPIAPRGDDDSTRTPFHHEPSCPVLVDLRRASDGDRKWFRRHPGVDVRVRPLTHGERLEMKALGKVIRDDTVARVVQLTPGVRLRQLGSPDSREDS